MTSVGNKDKSPIDFWGIGAQKAGTTWLHHNLSKIPEFSIPPVKEFHYFDRSPNYPSPNYLTKTRLAERIFTWNYLKKAGKDIALSMLDRNSENFRFYLNWYFENYSDEWYVSLFRHFDGLKGEITPSYAMLSKKDIGRMYNISPDAKLILMVRNPIDRAWSHFRHTKKRIKGFTLQDVQLEEIKEFMNSEGQEKRSDYSATIEAYCHFFPKDQILIGFYDAIIEAPEKLLKEVVHFLSPRHDIPARQLEEKTRQSTKKVINKSIEMECPTEIVKLLQDKYHDKILSLAMQYGGYFSKWYHESYGDEAGLKVGTCTPTIRL